MIENIKNKCWVKKYVIGVQGIYNRWDIRYKFIWFTVGYKSVKGTNVSKPSGIVSNAIKQNMG